MPSNLMFADSSFPVIGEGEDTRAALKKIQNYLYMLLEQLRYTLSNLEPGNFNESEMADYIKKLTAGTIVAQTIISSTVITNELYAQYGNIADLTVDKLRTDYKRARKYLNGDTGQIDYISIHDEVIEFITSVTDGSETEQLTVDGKAFYWTDASKTQMTREKVTEWPVIVWKYNEYRKAAFHFEPVALENGGETPMPVLTFGTGTGEGDNGKAWLFKNESELAFKYQTRYGQTAAVTLRDDGFVDANHRRADITIDTKAGKITVSPEGTLANAFDIAYTEDGDTLTLAWPDGKTFRVVKA